MSVGERLRHARVTGWAGRPLDDPPGRSVGFARSGMLAVVVALTAAAGDLVQSWWWLAALAIVALAAIGAHRVLPMLWVLAPAEPAVAALVIGLGMRDAY